MKLELDVNRDLGTLIKAMRLRAGMTQEQLSKKLGVSRPAIPNMEAGKQNIYLHHLLRTADSCGFEVKLKVSKLRKK